MDPHSLDAELLKQVATNAHSRWQKLPWDPTFCVEACSELSRWSLTHWLTTSLYCSALYCTRERTVQYTSAPLRLSSRSPSPLVPLNGVLCGACPSPSPSSSFACSLARFSPPAVQVNVSPSFRVPCHAADLFMRPLQFKGRFASLYLSISRSLGRLVNRLLKLFHLLVLTRTIQSFATAKRIISLSLFQPTLLVSPLEAPARLTYG